MLLSSLKNKLLILLLFLIGSSFAQKQVEKIDRGIVAIRTSSQEVFMVHEEPANYGIHAVEMRDAATGAIVTSNQLSAWSVIMIPIFLANLLKSILVRHQRLIRKICSKKNYLKPLCLSP